MQLVDPGASLFFGKGFSSSTYPYQRPNEFFVGQAPGFMALMALWFSVFGFGMVEARSLSYFAIALAMPTLWLAMRRFVPEMPRWLRVLCCFTAFTGTGVTFNTWTARYDAVGIFIFCALVLAWSYRDSAVGRGSIAFLAAVAFLVGFQLAFLLVVWSLIALAVEKRRALPQLKMLWLGLIAGAMSWLSVVSVLGDPILLLKIVLGSKVSIVGQFGQLVLQNDQSVIEKFSSNGMNIFRDPSFAIMFSLLVAVLFMWSRQRTVRESVEGVNLVLLGGGMTVFAPIAVFFFGNYPIYYSWMGFIPATVVCAVATNELTGRSRKIGIPAYCIAACFSIAVGIIAETQRVMHDDGTFGYARFERAIVNDLNPTDWVFVDPAAYFAARSVADSVFADTYGQTVLVPGIPERESISVLIVHRKNFTEVTKLIGGTWQLTQDIGATLGLSGKLDFIIARRQE